ncbi:MAG: T9SS type A sorting domain-containing protein, partial [Flavobacteriaceae bacterium]|nr:T9SS type A sorting domain-containing protein [Flavobacteriaceae bacterium]
IAVSSGTVFNAYGWGSVFLDSDLDMDQDLYVSGLYNTANTTLLPYGYFQNDGNNQFSEPTNTGFEVDDRSSFSNAIGDYNNDGLIDIAVANNQDADLFVWKNETTNSNNWIKLKLEGTISNRDGIGSVIEIGIEGESQFYYTACGEGYLSQNSQYEIIGLGTTSSVDFIRIKWLSGVEDYFYNLAANQSYDFTEGTGTLSDSNSEISEDVELFPNPVEEFLQIRTDFPIEEITIFDSLGKTVLKAEINGAESIKLSLNPLNSGVYFVQIKTITGNFIEKILKR